MRHPWPVWTIPIPDGKNLYVTSRDDNKLLVLSAVDLSLKAEVATGDEPYGVAYRK